MRIREITSQLFVTSNLERVPLVELAAKIAPFKAIVSLVGKEIPFLQENMSTYEVYPIPDSTLKLATIHDLDNLADILAKQIEQGKKVLINCNAGRNRSCLLAAMVLMKSEGFSGEMALDYVRKQRPNAIANPNFENFLLGK